MKLATGIKPNANGVVILHGIDGKDYTFKVDVECGALACVIDNADVQRHVLSLGDSFYPADEASGQAAEDLFDELSEDELQKLVEAEAVAKVAAVPVPPAPAPKVAKVK